jgi:hypothetical protein
VGRKTQAKTGEIRGEYAQPKKIKGRVGRKT